ncbi:secretin N-terminal domain-containing protein [Cerasicoccus frondis]|uniref:secretin N-terminal domain-containing protein n=1 Tax=Cerasicoccus frondis TaxID=490090 RepID=UPI002852B8D0|nr:secretin N-terminal domain-containing protein [Cerasicoccus frondis]
MSLSAIATPLVRLWLVIAAMCVLSASQLLAQPEPDDEPVPEFDLEMEPPQVSAPGGRGAPVVNPRTSSRVPSAQRNSLQAANAQASGSEPTTAQPAQEVELIMVDMELNDVLLNLEQLTKKPIIRSQSLPAVKINFNGQGPMSKDEAILVIKSLLALNGVIVTDLGQGLIKAVPAAGASGATAQVPEFIHGSTLGLPPSQAYYTKFFKFNYLDAEKEGTVVVQSLSSGGIQPVVFPKNNALLVTDMLVNLQRMEEVLETADMPDYDNERIFFFNLKHIKAPDLAQRLTKLTTGTSGIARYFNNNTTFEADERTNQLIAITHPSNKVILENLIAELDKDVEPITSSEVFYIKHAQATEIDSLLEEVITGQQNARNKSESADKNKQQSPESNTAVGPGGQDALAADAAPMPSPDSGLVVAELGKNLQFSDFVTVVADERSNSIVAYGTKSDLIQIGRLIEQIDVLLAQVYIEVLIAEVTLTDNSASGFSEFSLEGSAVTSNLTASTAVNQGQLSAAPFSIDVSLNPDTFEAVLRTAAENTNIRILSVPNIVTTHNQEANVNVSQSQPIITSSVTNLTSNNTDGTTSNDVQYRDIGIQLTVKPLIGSNGIIQMEIEQIVENVVDTTPINGTDQPIIGKREATSFVSVSDGQVIVLAGLQSTQFNTSDGKLWIIGDIPIIGDLLNPESETNERRELMIFIRPTVYFGPEDAHKHAQKIIGHLDNGSDVSTFLQTDDMTQVTKVQRIDALKQSEELETETGEGHPFNVNAPLSDSEQKKSAKRSPYSGN